MIYGLLFFIGYLLGLVIGLFLASHWNKEIIENQKENINELINDIENYRQMDTELRHAIRILRHNKKYGIYSKKTTNHK